MKWLDFVNLLGLIAMVVLGIIFPLGMWFLTMQSIRGY